jgi:hypothetical protein
MAQTRRDRLGELFDQLDVEEGHIVGVKPREGREAEVATLIDILASQGARRLGVGGPRGHTIRTPPSPCGPDPST